MRCSFLFLGVVALAVEVVSVRSFGWLGVDYVGRGRGSVLGNPFVVGRDGSRSEVVALYRVWLWGEVRAGLRGEGGVVWAELLRLARLVRAGERVVLGCWCVPLACHGEVVRSCLLWLVAEGFA